MSTHALHGVALRGVDDVGGAELARVGELVLQHVDGDDAARAGEPRALDDVEADAAAADDEDGGAAA